MSATSTLTGTGMAGSWPMARVMAGASAVPVGHAIDLAFFLSEEAVAPHDALVAETRRHLGGCAQAIEMALRLSLTYPPEIAAALDHASGAIAWPMIRARPTLLSPAVLGHMKMRAALTLMLRQHGQADVEQASEAGASRLPATDDPVLGDAAAALAIAEGRWLMPGGEDQPMRPDLPAEHVAELVWTVAACLALRLEPAFPHARDRLYAAIERAGWALLADHDEGASPIVLAQQLVRRMGEAADDPELLGMALDQRRFLLFAALAARHLRLECAQLIDMLLLGPVAQVGLLCKALGGSDADYRYMLLALRPARPSLSDAAVLAEAERYGALGEAEADAVLGTLRTPEPFRAKIGHLRALAGA